ncbi:MAG TPA: hypothetical protein VGS11_08585 [Candidatus Bathyarchaeia archaeon]|nr:hypothetical protein [Candidatus Bathyarchaeia archaeon]
MSEQYHRLFLRWEVLRGWIPAIIFAAICVGMELLFFYNALNTGFVDKAVSIPIGSWNVPISIALSLSLANALVVVTLWMNVFESTAYVRAGSDKQVRRILYPLRMIRTAALVLAPFAIILFAPYIVEANWFVNTASSIQQFKQTSESFYSWAFSVSQIDGATRFIISQIVAAWGALIVAGLQLWRVKGTKNIVRAFRRRK